jgi:hypothetical protein
MTTKRQDEPIDIPGPQSVGHELATSDAMTLSRAEIDMQITTAKQFPRDTVKFERVAMVMVEKHMAMSNDPKDGLFYTLVKGGSKIEGPNVRLAEIIAHNWGNCRAGARPIGEDEAGKNVICEGVFHDLETNTAIRMYTKRRIYDREGRRYQEEMVGVTENAGCGIAYRNAVLKGVPKVFWWPLYLKARKLAGGVSKDDTAEKRTKLLATCAKYKIPEDKVFATLAVKKATEIDADKVATLHGLLTAIAHQETTIAKAFGVEAPKTKSEVKETVAADEETITKNSVLDVMSLMQDWHINTVGLRKALDSIGHKDVLDKLPKAKLKALTEKLEAMKK